MNAQQDMRLKLACALTNGAFETPRWRSFLDLLCTASDATYATLAFRPPGRPFEEMLILVSGSPASVLLDAVYHENFHPLPPPFNERMEEGRTYSQDEWLALLDIPCRKATEKYLKLCRVTDIREMRVQEPSGIHAWLSITRVGGDFPPATSVLLEEIAPALRGALQNFIALEREKFKSLMNADAARRLHFSWLALDRNGRIVDCNEQAAEILENSGIIGRGANDQLTASAGAINRKIRTAIENIISGTRRRPSAISLSNDPWLDMLLLPAEQSSISARVKPEVIAYIHGDSWRVSDRTAQLAELFSLTPREARLALAFCRGLSITEAATEFGLTVPTTRNYSKMIYAKTGTRGMADLVRLVMRSALALSPA